MSGTHETSVRKTFQELGDAILGAWRARDFDQQSFPDIAVSALRSARLSERIGAREILELAASDRPDMEPLQFEPGFGDYQYVAYRHGRFYIEVLLWMNSTTSIHEHAFSGAFTLLEGSSVQAVYDFDEQERVNQNLRIGVLKARQVELLFAGDVVPIRAGRSLIHSAFHLDDPTISIVARTVQDDEALPQLDYCGGRIGYKNDMTQGEAKSIKAIRLLARYWPSDFWPDLARRVAAMSRDQKFWVMKALFREMQALEGEERASVQNAVGGDWPVFSEALRDEALVHSVARLRESVRSVEARRLLAFLVSVPGRADFDKAVVRHLPNGAASALSDLLAELGLPGPASEITGSDLAMIVTRPGDHARTTLDALARTESVLTPVWVLMSRCTEDASRDH